MGGKRKKDKSMTLIIGWIACDNNREGKMPSALYFGSDSRYAWGRQHAFNYGKKVYASNRFPEIFAYCGSVTFANIILPPLINLIDSGAFFSGQSADEKAHDVSAHFKAMTDAYVKDPALGQTVILYGTKVNTRFFEYRFSFINKTVKVEKLPLNDYSSIIAVEGSGVKPLEERLSHPLLQKDLYSREICHYLADTIENNEEFSVGGIPQIVGLYRGIAVPQVFGFVKDGKSYLFGNEVDASQCDSSIAWRNTDFEIIDPNTLKLKEGAQAQPFLR